MASSGFAFALPFVFFSGFLSPSFAFFFEVAAFSDFEATTRSPLASEAVSAPDASESLSLGEPRKPMLQSRLKMTNKKQRNVKD
jgi:hypothetical protein